MMMLVIMMIADDFPFVGDDDVDVGDDDIVVGDIQFVIVSVFIRFSSRCATKQNAQW